MATSEGRVLLVTLALLDVPSASAQGPPCPEFRVNTSTTLDQVMPDVAADAGGGFVVAWVSDHQGGYPDFDIFAQRFGASGSPLGPEFRVNTFTTSMQTDPAVAVSPAGAFVVTWFGYGAAEDSIGVFARRFDATGAAQGPEFRVNTYSTGSQYSPSIGMDGTGRFVVAWTSYPQDGSESGIYAQRFAADGSRLGPEFRVNTYTPDYQTQPAVAVAPSGEFVIVWASLQDGSARGVFGQRFDSSGAPQGPEFLVNTYTTGSQGQPRVAYGRNGDFVVVWRSFLQDGDSGGLFGQRFDAAGTRLGAEFQVNVQTTDDQAEQAIAGVSDGGYVVVWRSGPQGPGDSSVVGRRLSAQGVPQGGEFLLNTFAPGRQFLPSVAAQPNRGFVATWTSDAEDGSLAGIYASVECARLYAVTPCRLVDTRSPPGPTGGPALGANTARTFPLSGACGIPPDATAVALNAAAVNATDLGNLRLFPAGQPVPLASSLNFVPGRTRANNATVPLGTNGSVTVQCDMPAGSTGATQLVLDVYGYFKR
jgi:hypothetical protein